MAGQNAAIYYVQEAFDTSQDRLLGRRAAGEGYLNAFANYADVERLFGYCQTREVYQSFRDFVRGPKWHDENTHWIAFNNLKGLSQVGCMFYGSPGIGQFAWQRRFLGQRNYSLCGVTHTTASHGVMDTIGDLQIAPLQSWDAIICTSSVVRKTFEQVLENWAEYLADRMGASAKVAVQLPVIPLGVDCAAFAKSPETEAYRTAFRAQHGIGEDDIVVLFMGRLSYHAKAHPLPMYLALEQAAQATGKRIHCLQVGWFANEPIESAFRQGAKTHCPSVNAIFIDGRDREVRRNIWFVADVFSSLSDNIQETFGLAPIEAMAAGLPVVVSDWDGYRDTARHGQDGFLIPTAMPPGGLGRDLALRHAVGSDSYDLYIGHASQFTAVDIGACAEAYRTLFTDPELRQKMGAAGRQRALETFDWPKVVGAYQELWQELAARRAKDTELAPAKRSGTVSPSRDDPFSVFNSYPTQSIQATTRVVLQAGATAERLRAFRRDPLTSLSHGLLSPEAECEAVIERLGASGNAAIAVEDLIAALPETRQRAQMQRTIGWLAKIGAIAILPDA